MTLASSSRSLSVAAYNARQSKSQVELSHISVSLEFECFLEKIAVIRVNTLNTLLDIMIMIVLDHYV